MIKNNKGVVTIDFIFAFVLVMGFFVVMFSLTMTLSMVEITQYITFSSSRNYFASHITEGDQRDQAFQKYKALLENPVLQPMFNNGWFEVDINDPVIGNVADVKQGYSGQPLGVDLFRGTGTNFTAKILDFRVPFFGGTSNEPDGQGFQTFIGSYLSREVTFAECWNFNNERWNAIRRLPNSTGAPYSDVQQTQAYLAISDNGC